MESNSFFRDFYFELKVDIPMNVSTNTLRIMDFLKKEVEIDLIELANNYNISIVNTIKNEIKE